MIESLQQTEELCKFISLVKFFIQFLNLGKNFDKVAHDVWEDSYSKHQNSNKKQSFSITLRSVVSKSNCWKRSKWKVDHRQKTKHIAPIVHVVNHIESLIVGSCIIPAPIIIRIVCWLYKVLTFSLLSFLFILLLSINEVLLDFTEHQEENADEEADVHNNDHKLCCFQEISNLHN